MKVKGETYLFNIFRESDPEEPQMSVQLVNAGTSVVRSHAYRRNSCPRARMFVWQYTEEGAGAIDFPDGTVILKPGMSFFIYTEDKIIYYLPPKSSYWKFTYISVNGADAARLYEQFRRKHGMILHHEKDSETLRCVRGILSEIREEGLLDPYRTSLFAYRFLTSLFHETDQDIRHSAHPLADRLTREISAHPEVLKSVSELAALCNFSRTHFTRIFHEENGVAPAEFVKDLRLKIAAHMLETELVSVKDIAARTGFVRPEYFCQVFRRKYHCSPGEYREKTSLFLK